MDANRVHRLRSQTVNRSPGGGLAQRGRVMDGPMLAETVSLVGAGGDFFGQHLLANDPA
jgi:hypothetical protein